jgi:hypothetical protein
MRLLGRRDCPPRRSLGHPAGPQPVAHPGRAGTTGAVSAARPRHEVLPRLGRRGPLPGWGRAGGTGPGAQGERVRGALGPHSPYRVPGLAADRRPRPPGPSSGRIIEALCVDATCSVVCSTSTGELHERLRAPFSPPYRARFLRSPDSAATSKLPSPHACLAITQRMTPAAVAHDSFGTSGGSLTRLLLNGFRPRKNSSSTIQKTASATRITTVG